MSSIGEALSSGALSAQLAPAVAGVVQDAQVSAAIGNVVKTAAQSGNLTLVGNGDMDFEDKNGNNVPDEYEDGAEKLLLLGGGA